MERELCLRCKKPGHLQQDCQEKPSILPPPPRPNGGNQFQVCTLDPVISDQKVRLTSLKKTGRSKLSKLAKQVTLVPCPSKQLEGKG